MSPQSAHNLLLLPVKLTVISIGGNYPISGWREYTHCAPWYVWPSGYPPKGVGTNGRMSSGGHSIVQNLPADIL
ncbi:hypothetical protein FHS20_004277 [Phyllobacterium endophyticum]|nr:hypothetical protein [Phyllobacterium endophyticum]